MGNEALVFDADLSPVNWFLNGIWHYDSLNSDILNRNIYCVAPDIEDWVSMTDPVGDIGALVEMRITIKNKSVSAEGSSSGLVGCAYHILKSDDTELGSYGLQMATNLSPHEYNVVVPLVGVGADTPNMKMRIRSFSIGTWPVGQGLIETYQILPTLYYTEPILKKQVKHIQLDVSSGEPSLNSAPDEIELKISSGETSLAAAPAAIELPTASGEIVLLSEVVEEDV